MIGRDNFRFGTASKRSKRIMPLYRLNPDTGQRVETLMRWGLIPHSADKRPHFQPTYARSDMIVRRQMFREAYHKRRCIVPMAKFYLRDRQRKRRTVAHKAGSSLHMAGIWENWRDHDTGQWERTFAKVTVKANDLIAAIHSRMPLILDDADLQRWMGPDRDPHDLLRPCPTEILVVTVNGDKAPLC
jgi:putative SOS response-associated peptidase YedK